MIQEPDNPVLATNLSNLHAAAADTVSQTVARQQAKLGSVLQLDLDILQWEKRLGGRPESKQIGEARKQLAFATYFASTGAYNAAYSSIRLFLELSFAAVYFSANELARRKWISDRYDFSWSQALDADNGVLSNSFVQEFNAEAALDAKQYATQAARCYRLCSQFIHGKAFITDQLPTTLTYSASIVEQWAETARHAAESVLYLFFCRYFGELSLNDDGRLAGTLEHSFGHLAMMRRTLGLPADEGGSDGR